MLFVISVLLEVTLRPLGKVWTLNQNVGLWMKIASKNIVMSDMRTLSCDINSSDWLYIHPGWYLPQWKYTGMTNSQDIIKSPRVTVFYWLNFSLLLNLRHFLLIRNTQGVLKYFSSMVWWTPINLITIEAFGNAQTKTKPVKECSVTRCYLSVTSRPSLLVRHSSSIIRRLSPSLIYRR